MRFLRCYGAHICLALLALLALAVWMQVLAQPKAGELEVAVLDIGQGDSIYIKSPTGVEVLIDGGPDSSVLRELPKVMAYGDRTIDAVISTHPDADHIGGLVDVLPRYTVKNFIEPGIEKHTATNDKLEGEVSDEHIPVLIARRGQWLDLGGGAELYILYPDTDVSGFGDHDNDGCVVVRLVYKNTSAIFTCDAPEPIEDHLIDISDSLSTSTTLKSDLYKAGHHGSKYSSSNEFLDALGATFAAISVGANNRYGHPTEEALGRLKAHGMQIDRTDLEGTLIYISDGEKFTKK